MMAPFTVGVTMLQRQQTIPTKTRTTTAAATAVATNATVTLTAPMGATIVVQNKKTFVLYATFSLQRCQDRG